jgi:hypothetical protein
MAINFTLPEEEAFYIQIHPLITIDREDKVILCKGVRIRLTALEYAIIECLVDTWLSSPHHCGWCSLSRLVKEVYPPRYKKEKGTRKLQRVPDPVDKEAAVQKAVSRIRSKVSAVPGCPTMIECRTGHGYRLVSSHTSSPNKPRM